MIYLTMIYLQYTKDRETTAILAPSICRNLW
jgi:hypothetical protein